MPLIEVVNTVLGGGCYKFSETVDLENPQAASCSPEMKVGYDTGGCKGKAVSTDSLARIDRSRDESAQVR